MTAPLDCLFPGVRLNNQVSCSIEMFEDSWTMFEKEPKLFKALGKLGGKATIKEVVDILESLGYENTTQEKNAILEG